MSKFGWSLPPGCTHRMVDEAYGCEEPCRVCGQPDAYIPGTGTPECVCPECPECGAVGDPACYDGVWHCSWCGPRPDGTPCWLCQNPGFAANGYPQSERRIFEWWPPHGLVRSFAQVALWSQAEEGWGVEAEAEAAGIAAIIKGWEEEA